MHKTSIIAFVAVLAVLCPSARADGGVTVRPSGPCGPTVPGEMITIYNTMSRRATVYLTQITNGVSTELTREVLPNSQYDLGCSVHGMEQRTWVIKAIKQPDPPPARR